MPDFASALERPVAACTCFARTRTKVAAAVDDDVKLCVDGLLTPGTYRHRGVYCMRELLGVIRVTSGHIYSFRALGGGLGRLTIWHLPRGPVGPPARWAATSNVGGSGKEESNHGP